MSNEPLDSVSVAEILANEIVDRLMEDPKAVRQYLFEDQYELFRQADKSFIEDRWYDVFGEEIPEGWNND